MPPPPASVPTDALSKWRLWEDEESMEKLAVSLLLHDEGHMDEGEVGRLLASKGD